MCCGKHTNTDSVKEKSNGHIHIYVYTPEKYREMGNVHPERERVGKKSSV